LKKTNPAAYDKKVATLNDRIVQLQQRQDNDKIAINKIKTANRGAVGGNLSRRQINERKVNYNKKDVNRESYRGRTPTKTRSAASVARSNKASQERGKALHG